MPSSLKDALAARAVPARGEPYRIGPAALPVVLSEQGGALPEPLQIIARQYIGARQRSGEALLEAARWLSEARALASHGEWQLFKQATYTSDDSAERLLNIHARAMQNPQFADAIARNWLSQTAAALLARQSTPPEVIGEVLQQEQPPTKQEVEQRIRTARTGQNPHSADFAPSAEPSAPPAPQLEPLRRLLRTTAEDLRLCAAQVADLTPAERTALQGEIEALRAAIAEF